MGNQKFQSKKAYQLEENEDGKVFGELDVNKQHPFPKGWMGRVVVRQSAVEKLASGTIVEDPGSIRIMNYETEVFNRLGKTEFFVYPMKVTILHDPR